MVGGALKRGLGKTRRALRSAFSGLRGGRSDSAVSVELIEDALLIADLGPGLSAEVAERTVSRLAGGPDEVRVADVLRDELSQLVPPSPPVALGPPTHTVLVVGVNGCGKTTTVAKLAAKYRRDRRSVMIAAADTFRAAAAEQMEVLAERAGARVVRHRYGADPASVVYDCLQAARSRGIDVVLVDTGGRVQTRTDLMDELVKIRKVMGGLIEGAPHEVLLVLDGTTGQNALSQAAEFHAKLGLTGVVVAKLDGTAKGGAVLAVGRALGVPVRYVGVGEGLDDLEDFRPEVFAEAMVGDL